MNPTKPRAGSRRGPAPRASTALSVHLLGIRGCIKGDLSSRSGSADDGDRFDRRAATGPATAFHLDGHPALAEWPALEIRADHDAAAAGFDADQVAHGRGRRVGLNREV